MANTKIIVLDDDPTGSQTVHSCLLLTRWDVATLKAGAAGCRTAVFRAHQHARHERRRRRPRSPARCASISSRHWPNWHRAGTPINPLLVSRSDSTLRGHYPVETDVIAEELGPFDAHFLVPAFFEGGRITRDSMHYLMVERQTGAGARNRVCARLGVRLFTQLPARLRGRENRRPHPADAGGTLPAGTMCAATACRG